MKPVSGLLAAAATCALIILTAGPGQASGNVTRDPEPGVIPAGHPFMILGVNSGRCAAVMSNKEVKAAPCNADDKAELWTYSTTTHQFRNGRDNVKGMCLEANKSAYAVAENTLTMYNCEDRPRQRWSATAHNELTQLWVDDGAKDHDYMVLDTLPLVTHSSSHGVSRFLELVPVWVPTAR